MNLIYRFILTCSFVCLAYTFWVYQDEEYRWRTFVGECQKDGGKVIPEQGGFYCISPAIVI